MMNLIWLINIHITVQFIDSNPLVYNAYFVFVIKCNDIHMSELKKHVKIINVKKNTKVIITRKTCNTIPIYIYIPSKIIIIGIIGNTISYYTSDKQKNNNEEIIGR